MSSYETPEWYRNAKFGIFIHRGIYSVPAFDSEWYSRNMYIQGSPEYEHHIKTYGSHREFGYKDFIPMFKAGFRCRRPIITTGQWSGERKWSSFQFGTAVPDVERGQFADVKPYFWQTDMAVFCSM